MKARRYLIPVAAYATACAMFLGSTSNAHAQAGADPACAAGVSQDACQKAVDVFKFLAPQLGTLVAGGNATLGQGGPLGGFPHFRVGLRANMLGGKIPELDGVTPSVTGRQVDTYDVKDQFLALPQLDAAVGLFRGLPLGITNVGGLDFLVSATYLPSFSSSSVKVDAGTMQLGYGLRLGILQESLLTPGVSVTWMRRDLPSVDIRANSGDDSLFIDGLKVKTNAWRLVASKNLLALGIAAGLGKDRYDSNVSARTYLAARTVPPVPETTAGPFNVAQKLTRTTMFLDVSVNFPFLKLVGEIGRVSGGNVDTYNQFNGSAADEARTYGSLGVRMGF